MKKKLLFIFVGKPTINSNSEWNEGSVIIENEIGYGKYNRRCFVNENTEVSKEIMLEAVKLMQSEVSEYKDIFLGKEFADNIHLLPLAIRSVVYNDRTVNKDFDGPQSKNACIEFLNKLPPHVTEVKIRRIPKKWEKPHEIIAAIPKHVTSISLPSNLLQGCTDDELRKLFSSFHNQIKEIHIIGEISDNDLTENKKLRNLIIQLPFSVETLTVPNSDFSEFITKKIKVQQYREDQYFPASYSELTASSTDNLFEKAKNLLNDYTKNTSLSPGLTLFSTFHWNRHHISQVNNILKESKSIDDLLSNLSKIENGENFNPAGSLARRIHYIKFIQYQEQNLVNEDELSSASPNI